MGKISELDMAISDLRKAAATINDVADTLAEMFNSAATEEAPVREPPLTLEQVRAVLAEKSRNGDFSGPRGPGRGEGAKALIFFGYSGVGSMAMAQSGAGVCHLDASRGMIEWGRENLALNPRVPDAIRWIADDVTKFKAREVRRGSKYNLVALDPPTFGRGSSGQVWKIEEDLPKLLARCAELRDRSRPFTVVLSCHSPGFSVLVLERLAREAFGAGGEFVSGEMTVPESTGRELPAGICVRYRVG